MEQLHWHTEENPCVLLGKAVTPEESVGWLVDAGYGPWKIVEPGLWPEWEVSNWFIKDGDLTYSVVANPALSSGFYQVKPIYPPAGWNGKTEAEIWEAMQVDGREEWEDEDWAESRRLRIGACYIDRQGRIYLYYYDSGEESEVIDPAALVIDLGNAAALSKRLQEANNASVKDIPRDPTQDIGYIEHVKASHGGDIVLYDSAVRGLTNNGKYTITCDTENESISTDRYDLAQAWMNNPRWCPHCLRELGKLDPK